MKCFSRLCSVQSKSYEPGDARSSAPPRPDAALSLGMAFVEAAGVQTKGREDAGGGGGGCETAGIDEGRRGGEGADRNPLVRSTELSQMDQLR